MEWINWLREWGDAFYPVAFLWSFFEGETFVIFGGWAASLGVLDINLLIATVWLGSFCGDQMWFWLGRRWGVKALDRFPAAGKRAATVHAWLERYGVGFILTFRFLYGVRNIASVALGTSHIPWRTFLFWNFIAAGLWAFAFAGAGYLFGEAAASFGESGTKILLVVAAAVIAAMVAWKSIAWNRRRLGARRLAAAESAAAAE